MSLSAWPSRNPATSAATAWARSARAPLRSTSVSGSESMPGWESWKTLLSVTAYHSFSGEVQARTPPRYAAPTLSCRHQLLRIARHFALDSIEEADEFKVAVALHAAPD